MIISERKRARIGELLIRGDNVEKIVQRERVSEDLVLRIAKDPTPSEPPHINHQPQKRLTSDQRAEIARYALQGKSISEASSTLGISYSATAYHFRKIKERQLPEQDAQSEPQAEPAVVDEPKQSVAHKERTELTPEQQEQIRDCVASGDQYLSRGIAHALGLPSQLAHEYVLRLREEQAANKRDDNLAKGNGKPFSNPSAAEAPITPLVQDDNERLEELLHARERDPVVEYAHRITLYGALSEKYASLQNAMNLWTNNAYAPLLTLDGKSTSSQDQKALRDEACAVLFHRATALSHELGQFRQELSESYQTLLAKLKEDLEAMENAADEALSEARQLSFK